MGQEHKNYTWNLIAKKLTGEATPEELQELERLLRSNPDLHYPMQTIADLWDQVSPGEQKAAEQAFNRHLDRMKELNIDFDPKAETGTNKPNPKADKPETSAETLSERDDVYPFPRNRSKITQRRIMAVSALAAAVMLGIFFAVSPSTFFHASATPNPAATVARVNSEISTRNGSKTHLVLPDGTLVWLNAGSRITYDKNYGVTNREINLIGEAFFEVARNAERPFVIHTERIDIKVLGTRFNVKSYPMDKTTEATLIRGSIEVSIKDRPSEKIILKPNEKLVVANDDSALQRKNLRTGAGSDKSPESLVNIRKPTYEPVTGAIVETSWVDNKLIFQEEEFDELARRMERWYGVTIRFDNPRMREWQFTGTFQNETIQQALDALKLTANFYYRIDGTQIVIYGKG
jgi:transmembrane sensor